MVSAVYNASITHPSLAPAIIWANILQLIFIMIR